MIAALERWRKQPMAHDPHPPRIEPVERPLSRQAQAAIEAHYVEIVELRDQRDKARIDLEKAKELCTQATHRINGLAEEISELKGRCTGYQLERDEAVAKLAKAEGKLSQHLATLRASITNLESPSTPLQRIADNAEAPQFENCTFSAQGTTGVFLKGAGGSASPPLGSASIGGGGSSPPTPTKKQLKNAGVTVLPENVK